MTKLRDNLPKDTVKSLEDLKRSLPDVREVPNPMDKPVRKQELKSGALHSYIGKMLRTQYYTGGSSAFDPSDLGLDLDLRTPNSALNTVSERTNNGLIAFNDPATTSDPDVATYIDQTSNSFDFTAPTAAKMGHWDNTDFTVDHDGLDDEYDDVNGFTAAHLGDTIGEFAFVYEDDDTGMRRLFGFWEVAAVTNNRLIVRINASDELEIMQSIAGVNNTINYGAGNLNIGGRNTIFFSGNGSAYTMIVNGVAQSVVSGTNDGKMQGANANLDEFQFLTRSGIFYAGGFRALMYKGGSQLSASERTNLKTWLDSNV